MLNYCGGILIFLAAAAASLVLARYSLRKRPVELQEETTETTVEAEIEKKDVPNISRKIITLYLTGAVITGAGAAYTIGLNTNLMPVVLAYLCMGWAAAVDGQTHIIPNAAPLTMVVGALLNLLLLYLHIGSRAGGFVFSCLVAGMLTFALMFFASVLTKGGLGMGDVKLLGALGLLCGLGCIIGTLFSATILAVLAAVYLMVRRRAGWKYAMPFGPFLYIGFMAAVILGIC